MKQICVELQESMGNDKSIAEAAWTSSLDYQKKKSRTEEDVKRVINLLADQKHSVPFESVVFRFWLKIPIQTDRQHMTHRIASHSGMSGRYRTMPSEWLDVPQDVLDIIYKLRPIPDISYAIYDFVEQYNLMCKATNSLYNNWLKELKEKEKLGFITNREYKRAREFFRGVLPQNNMTERVTIMNLRSFANYQKLRNSEHAQPEIREVAEQMLEAVKKANVCPLALEALERNGWNI
jgi:flavin-dependent thymidylate synthase